MQCLRDAGSGSTPLARPHPGPGLLALLRFPMSFTLLSLAPRPRPAAPGQIGLAHRGGGGPAAPALHPQRLCRQAPAQPSETGRSRPLGRGGAGRAGQKLPRPLAAETGKPSVPAPGLGTGRQRRPQTWEPPSALVAHGETPNCTKARPRPAASRAGGGPLCSPLTGVSFRRSRPQPRGDRGREPQLWLAGSTAQLRFHFPLKENALDGR